MISHQLIYIVSQRLKPLISAPSVELTSDQSHQLCQLKAAVSRSTLIEFTKPTKYESNSFLDTLLAITEVFGFEWFCGGDGFSRDRQFVERIRGPILKIGTYEFGRRIGRSRQFVDRVIFGGGVSIQTADLISRSVFLPLEIELPSGFRLRSHCDTQFDPKCLRL